MGEIFKHLTETSSCEITWLVRRRAEGKAPAEEEVIHSQSTSIRTYMRSGPRPDVTAAEVSAETEINWLFSKDGGKRPPADVNVAPNRVGIVEVPTKLEGMSDDSDDWSAEAPYPDDTSHEDSVEGPSLHQLLLLCCHHTNLAQSIKGCQQGREPRSCKAG